MTGSSAVKKNGANRRSTLYGSRDCFVHLSPWRSIWRTLNEKNYWLSTLEVFWVWLDLFGVIVQFLASVTRQMWIPMITLGKAAEFLFVLVLLLAVALLQLLHLEQLVLLGHLVHFGHFYFGFSSGFLMWIDFVQESSSTLLQAALCSWESAHGSL